MKTANRVAVNSIALYVNMCFTMLATLLGTRYVLQALGREEFGLYALVGSIVAMLSFLNVAMAAATQRFLSFSIGAKDNQRVGEIFYTSVVIHLLISVTLAVLLLGVGEYLIYQVLQIQELYQPIAEVVLWCMIAGVLFTINAVPYEAAMNAHEDIAQIAVINILEALLKLGAAVAVLFLTADKLIYYALFVLGAQVIAFLCKYVYSKRKYQEARYRYHRLQDYALVKQMLGFAGWNLIGAGCSIARYQGAAILLNAFFGLVVNAAYGVAQQINGFILFFANSIVRPLRPLIVKSEGAGEHEKMYQLSFMTCRITFLMISFAIIPLYQNMPYVLSIWLDTIPEGALEFCRAFLAIALVSQLSIGISIAVESVGRIKRMQLIVGSMHLVALPLGYVAFQMGCSAYSIMYLILAEEIVSTILRLWIAKKDAGVPWQPFVKGTLVPSISCFVVGYGLSYVAFLWMDDTFMKLLCSGLFSTLVLLCVAYRWSLTQQEREWVKHLLQTVTSKFLKSKEHA